ETAARVPDLSTENFEPPVAVPKSMRSELALLAVSVTRMRMPVIVLLPAFQVGVRFTLYCPELVSVPPCRKPPRVAEIEFASKLRALTSLFPKDRKVSPLAGCALNA